MANGRKDIVFSALAFIEANFINIILVSTIFFFLISYLILNEVKFPSDNATLDKVVVMETMENKNPALRKAREAAKFKQKLAKGFCKKSESMKNLSPAQLEVEMNKENEKCKGLNSLKACSNSECCVWAKSKKGKSLCLGGSRAAGGPTKNPPNMIIDEYYYLGKKYKTN